MVDINLIGTEMRGLSPSLQERIKRINERANGTIAEFLLCLWLADLIQSSDDAILLLIPFKGIADEDAPLYGRITNIVQLLEHWNDSNHSQEMLKISDIIDLIIEEDIDDWDGEEYWNFRLILESLYFAVVRQVDMLKTNLS